MVKKRVTIVGSYNVGLFLKGDKHPSPGETVIGYEFLEGGGGKGSNQCIAAARLGAKAGFIGCIGDDKYGSDALAMYRQESVSTEGIIVQNGIHSGISVMLINNKGENMISVIPGANFRLNSKHIDAAEDELKRSFIVGFQLENNPEVVEYAIRKCSGLGVQVLLDPAPAQKLSDDVYRHITYLKPNEHEAEILSGIKVTDAGSASKAAGWFLEKGVENVLITLGEKGVVFRNKDEEHFFDAYEVDAVDTTGAGDCFSGAFMAAMASDFTVFQAIKFAIAASAISVTRLGVVDALPYAGEVEEFLNAKK